MNPEDMDQKEEAEVKLASGFPDEIIRQNTLYFDNSLFLKVILCKSEESCFVLLPPKSGKTFFLSTAHMLLQSSDDSKIQDFQANSLAMRDPKLHDFIGQCFVVQLDMAVFKINVAKQPKCYVASIKYDSLKGIIRGEKLDELQDLHLKAIEDERGLTPSQEIVYINKVLIFIRKLNKKTRKMVLLIDNVDYCIEDALKQGADISDVLRIFMNFLRDLLQTNGYFDKSICFGTTYIKQNLKTNGFNVMDIFDNEAARFFTFPKQMFEDSHVFGSQEKDKALLDKIWGSCKRDNESAMISPTFEMLNGELDHSEFDKVVFGKNADDYNIPLRRAFDNKLVKALLENAEIVRDLSSLLDDTHSLKINRWNNCAEFERLYSKLIQRVKLQSAEKTVLLQILCQAGVLVSIETTSDTLTLTLPNLVSRKFIKQRIESIYEDQTDFAHESVKEIIECFNRESVTATAPVKKLQTAFEKLWVKASESGIVQGGVNDPTKFGVPSEQFLCGCLNISVRRFSHSNEVGVEPWVEKVSPTVDMDKGTAAGTKESKMGRIDFALVNKEQKHAVILEMGIYNALYYRDDRRFNDEQSAAQLVWRKMNQAINYQKKFTDNQIWKGSIEHITFVSVVYQHTRSFPSLSNLSKFQAFSNKIKAHVRTRTCLINNVPKPNIVHFKYTAEPPGFPSKSLGDVSSNAQHAANFAQQRSQSVWQLNVQDTSESSEPGTSSAISRLRSNSVGALSSIGSRFANLTMLEDENDFGTVQHRNLYGDSASGAEESNQTTDSKDRTT
ncbi:putative AAA-ATPase domain-containing protein [Ditylenchus destructor]|uniref:AAA-ATPase domain-containing protein n=1 Tax=Ditylenchus destructor TaxID=166010 RepID=A0AAD4QZA4_9BILA|nr:putative AAA-ATPase domain-containing protein [Ditylenchus destructor]